jgi:hypothetical protein
MTSASTTIASSLIGALNVLCTVATCLAKAISFNSFTWSRSKNNKSNLERRAAGRLMFSCGLSFWLYLPYNGFAAAKIEVLAFKEVVIPALAIDTVYCSITSWIFVLSLSSILSNSSIQQIPVSDKTKAPPSKTNSFVVLSLVTAAVRPTPEEPLPVV